MMSTRTALFFLFAALLPAVSIRAQTRRIDTTAKLGSTGYRVSCNNKNESENEVVLAPKGFDKAVRDMTFSIRGRLQKILVDDFNDDGFADVIFCIYTGANGETINIGGFASSGAASIVAVQVPDIYTDPKLREGYKGSDEFTVMMGTLVRSFPLYKAGDTETPTGGKRVVQYKLQKDQGGNLIFKVLRSYDKQQ